MHYATIYIDPKGAAPIGFAQAAGMPGDIRFDFKTQGNFAYPNIASMYPQLVLRLLHGNDGETLRQALQRLVPPIP